MSKTFHDSRINLRCHVEELFFSRHFESLQPTMSPIPTHNVTLWMILFEEGNSTPKLRWVPQSFDYNDFVRLWHKDPCHLRVVIHDVTKIPFLVLTQKGIPIQSLKLTTLGINGQKFQSKFPMDWNVCREVSKQLDCWDQLLIMKGSLVHSGKSPSLNPVGTCWHQVVCMSSFKENTSPKQKSFIMEFSCP